MIPNATNRNDHMGGEGFVQGALEKGNHGREDRTAGGWRKGKVWRVARWVFIGLELSACCFGGESADERNWRVWLEPRSTHAPVTLPIAGADRTEVCAGFMEEAGPRAMTKEELAAMGIGMEKFAARARENASADLAKLKPRYTRNAKRVIEYAELRSARPVVAGAVLAPKFLALFRETLGEKVLVVVPNRFTAYVFPALAGSHADYAPMVLAALGATAWPVSVELFEVSTDGVRCVGRYAEP